MAESNRDSRPVPDQTELGAVGLVAAVIGVFFALSKR